MSRKRKDSASPANVADDKSVSDEHAGGDERPKQAKSNDANVARLVTPAKSTGRTIPAQETPTMTTRRSLFPPQGGHVVPITPARAPVDTQAATPTAKRKLIFGRLVDEIVVQDNVRQVYGIIRKLTGSIGGNGSHGPIYGELTMGSMQKMVNMMKEYSNFNSNSRFIDVGSGIGKPNLHVAQDPGVEFSYGIEVEKDRWVLGLNCLNAVLSAAKNQEKSVGKLPSEQKIQHKCIFEHADVRKAKSFDPFTHVYMFSIGFPPSLWVDLSEMWNQSKTPYLICFHGPKEIIKSYNFHVELVAQTSTSMHGSKEGHMGYIYRRSRYSNTTAAAINNACDPFFGRAWERVKRGARSLREEVERELAECMTDGPSTRTRRRQGTN